MRFFISLGLSIGLFYLVFFVGHSLPHNEWFAGPTIILTIAALVGAVAWCIIEAGERWD